MTIYLFNDFRFLAFISIYLSDILNKSLLISVPEDPSGTVREQVAETQKHANCNRVLVIVSHSYMYGCSPVLDSSSRVPKSYRTWGLGTERREK
jgi:hypothetical protein